MPNPFCFQLPVLFCGEAKHFKQYFILPHELFATFRKRMFGAEGAMERFWEQMQNHLALEDNPVTTKRNWKKRYIPFGLHGDGVPISGVGKSWQRSAEVWSWNSLLAWGPTMQMMHFNFALFKDIVSSRRGHDTRDTFMRLLAWSLMSVSVPAGVCERVAQTSPQFCYEHSVQPCHMPGPVRQGAVSGFN